jgi:hypothetical protein
MLETLFLLTILEVNINHSGPQKVIFMFGIPLCFLYSQINCTEHSNTNLLLIK